MHSLVYLKYQPKAADYPTPQTCSRAIQLRHDHHRRQDTQSFRNLSVLAILPKLLYPFEYYFIHST